MNALAQQVEACFHDVIKIPGLVRIALILSALLVLSPVPLVPRRRCSDRAALQRLQLRGACQIGSDIHGSEISVATTGRNKPEPATENQTHLKWGEARLCENARD